MRSFVFVSLWAVFGTAGCASQRHFEMNPPFSVARPTVQVFVAGREPGGTTTELSMHFSSNDPQGIEPDTLYFRGRALRPVLTETETGKVLVARYLSQPLQRPDLIMHADSLQEAGNQPPGPLPALTPIPIKLRPDEAVLVYRLRNSPTRHYYKISDIVGKPARAFPSRGQ